MLRNFLAALVTLLLAPAAMAAERVALVIGMGNYAHVAPLDNTLNDAKGIAETLSKIGFDVTLALDMPGNELRRVMEDFAFQAEISDLALVYFAGHGVEVAGENFLIPIDADVKSNLDVQRQSVSLKELLAVVDRARKMRVIILDSCRDNPIGGAIDLTAIAEASTGSAETRSAGGGLAAPSPDRGTMVAFAARDGQVALDGTGGQHSPYAEALIELLPTPGLEISLMFRQVRDEVLRKTGNQQEPHTYGSLSGEPFYVAAAPGVTVEPGTSPAASWSTLSAEQEPQLLALAETGDTRSLLGLAYLRLNPGNARYNPSEAAEYLQRAADAGAPDAQWELARLYEAGAIGRAPDFEKALVLYRASADQNYDKALNDMGYFYYQGALGLAQDVPLALEYFRKAADLRHPEAQFNYAAMIDDGQIDGKGPLDAANYLYEALRSGNEAVLTAMTERPLMMSLETRKALQEKLKRYGFYQGTIDGSFGPATMASLRAAFGLTEI